MTPSDDCPDVDTLLTWLKLPGAERMPSVTAHIFDCSSCTALVMGEVRLRQGDRLRTKLGAVAASIIIGVGVWQFGAWPVGVGAAGANLGPEGDPSSEVATANDGIERDDQGRPLADFGLHWDDRRRLTEEDLEFLAGMTWPSDLPAPVDRFGRMYIPDGFKPRPGDLTPYPADEEVIGERSDRVLAWTKLFHYQTLTTVYVEEGESTGDTEIVEGDRHPRDMGAEEFENWARSAGTLYVGKVYQATRRATAERNPAFIRVALLACNIPEFSNTTGFANVNYQPLRNYIRLFTPEEVFDELRFCAESPDPRVANRVESAREVYQSKFME